MTQSRETYLGDAVYASFDGWQICLRTGDGNNNTIYLEPAVYAALVRYADNLRDNAAEAAYERQQEEGPRGGEAASALAEEQAWIQRNLK